MLIRSIGVAPPEALYRSALFLLPVMEALNDGGKKVLLAYANKCHPADKFDKGDLNVCINLGLIDREKDHITDRGAAYAVSELGLSFTKFINIHSNWLARRFTSLAGTSTFRDVVNYALNYFPSSELLDLYMKERYATYLRHNSFDDYNAEAAPTSEQTKIFLGEMLLNLLKNPSIDWRQIKKMLSDADHSGAADTISNKEDLAAYIRSYLNYVEARSKG